MRVAVVGIGVAGAYLMNQLSNIHDIHVEGFRWSDDGKGELEDCPYAV